MSRIAKEGRKYGCYLGVVSQRPGELDPTILSQCSTVFAMRLANEQDQAIIRSAIADSSASTLSFLSSMGQREAIAFGEGVATTMRLKFEEMAPHLLPGAGKKLAGDGEPGEAGDIDLASIVDRLRNVPKVSAVATVGDAVSSVRQAGEADYRKPALFQSEVEGDRSQRSGTMGFRVSRD
jgi:DNA helicase HerA-like ATPase